MKVCHFKVWTWKLPLLVLCFLSFGTQPAGIDAVSRRSGIVRQVDAT